MFAPRVPNLGALIQSAFIVCALAFGAIWPASAQTDLDRSEIESIVREYILENPEIIRDAFQELERRQLAEQEQQQRNAIVANADALFRGENALVGGNPDGDVTLVEFFDYNCGFCKRALGDLKDLIASDPNLRVVYKEWPFLGPDSVEAARVSLAVSKQGRYSEFHDALLSQRGQANSARAMEIAEALGFDMDQLRTDMDAPEVVNTLEQTMFLAQTIGVTGTPSYVIGDQLIMGAQGFSALKDAVDTVRTEGCVAC
ncbi:MAG: DsbA family protein [Pseudomonadota bacterium]